MSDSTKITAIVGTYRTGGAVDQIVNEILSAAKKAGAEVVKIDLREKHIEFCTNCRVCGQQPGNLRGHCPISDDMSSILDRIEQSDAIILASPMNFWSVTAIMKRFIERLVCYAYWPWGKGAPKTRAATGAKRGVVVTTSAAPAIIARLMTPMIGHMKKYVRLLGAKKVDVLAVGLMGREQKPQIGAKSRAQAGRIGRNLARHRSR